MLTQREAPTRIGMTPSYPKRMNFLTHAKIVSTALLGGVVSAQSYTVVPLPVPGGRPQAIAPNGDVVGFYSNGGNVKAFRHEAASGVFVDLGTLPGSANAAARGVNVVGQIVGSSWAAPIQQPGRAFLFTPGAGMQDLGVLSGPTSVAYCIDDAGGIGGQADASAFTPEAMFVSPGGAMQSVLPGTSGNVLAADASGWVGGVLGNNQAFYLQPGSSTPVFVPLPTATPLGRVTSITSNGWMAGEMSDPSGSPSYAFRFHAPSGTLDNLGSISRFGTVGGIDSVGNVVATRQISSQSTPTALISLDGNQFVTLDSLAPPGWSIRTATGVNENGQVCGRAALSGGALQPVRLDPVTSGTIAASTSIVGGGCSSAVVRTAPPRVGRSWAMGMRGAAPGQTLYSLLALGHHPPIPMPGSSCDLFVSPTGPLSSTPATANGAGGWASDLAIPSSPSLVGIQLTVQLILTDPTAPLGFVATEAVQAVVGD